MDTDLNRGSAKIYQFPVGGRGSLVAGRYELGKAAAPRVNEAVFGSSWYHEEAVREAELANEH